MPPVCSVLWASEKWFTMALASIEAGKLLGGGRKGLLMGLKLVMWQCNSNFTFWVALVFKNTRSLHLRSIFDSFLCMVNLMCISVRKSLKLRYDVVSVLSYDSCRRSLGPSMTGASDCGITPGRCCLLAWVAEATPGCWAWLGHWACPHRFSPWTCLLQHKKKSVRDFCLNLGTFPWYFSHSILNLFPH